MVATPRRPGPARQSLRTAAVYVAAGTTVSRLTGLLRIVALAWALGQFHLADAFNLANTTPNMIYDIVLGGVLSATFIPVFVAQLANRTERDAFRSISAILTVSAVVLVVSTVARPGAGPALHHRPDRPRYVGPSPPGRPGGGRAGRRHHACCAGS